VQSEQFLGRIIVIIHTFSASIMASAYSVPLNFALLRCAKREESPEESSLIAAEYSGIASS
jgi:hypothetical protein